jgi:hypothetical protein
LHLKYLKINSKPINLKTKSFTTLTLFNFENNWYWPFKEMAFAKRNFSKIKGLEFIKVMGTGSGSGFSLKPDFTTYAILCVWNNKNSSEIFFKNHKKFNQYIKKSTSIKHIELKAVKSHGCWSGLQPFKSQEIKHIEDDNPVAVITRATLNWNRLISFWRSVPIASRAIEKAKGVIFYKGIGEWPFFQQATISIWKNFNSVNEFAYKQKEHTEIIRKTRINNWYKEDLFSRFTVISNSTNKFKIE